MSKLLVCALMLALDGGAPPPRQLSDEDKELIENLELLQDLDQATDLELLQELSVER